MSETPAVHVHDVWKKYQLGSQHYSLRDAIPAAIAGWWKRRGVNLGEEEFWALKNVSFDVPPGETLGIIGRNGAGKSTLLKLLSNIMKPSAGTISVDGKLAGLLEVGAGFHPDLTGRENVFLNGTILGLKRREIRVLFDQIVDFSEIGSFIDTPVKRYSSGMYVRLGFAIAAHVNANVLLIDEVLSVGDLAFQQKCLERIYELKKAGTTILFISHNLSAVQRICDRAILLSHGSTIADSNVMEAIKAYREQVITKEREQLSKTLAQQESRLGEVNGLRIGQVQLRNGAGEVTEMFGTGEPMTVEIAYTCGRPIASPTATLRIERLDGFVCHVASMARDGTSLPALNETGILRLTYPALNLLASTYRISVEIGEQGNRIPLDVRPNGCFFTVSSDHHEGGIIHLDHQWQVDGYGAGV